METNWPCLLQIPLLTLVLLNFLPTVLRCDIGRVGVHFTILKITTIKILIHEIKIKLKHSKFSVLINEKTYLHGKVQLDFFLARLHFKRIFFNLFNLSKEGFVY